MSLHPYSAALVFRRTALFGLISWGAQLLHITAYAASPEDMLRRALALQAVADLRKKGKSLAYSSVMMVRSEEESKFIAAHLENPDFVPPGSHKIMYGEPNLR